MPVLMLISYPCSCPCDICLSQIPNHFFLSFSFVMLWDRFVHIRRSGGGGGGRVRIWQADLTTWFFSRCRLKTFSFFLFFLPHTLVLLLFLCTFVIPHCVCVCPFPSTKQM